MIADERKRLLQTGVFKKEIDTVLFLLVKLIGSKEGPAGSWTLKEDFEKIGIVYGSATIGRYLKMLERARIRKQSSEALQINQYSDLIDLMKARKAIEIETVRLAAENASEQEIRQLRKTINVYYRYIAEKKDFVDPALDFHSIIADMSHNRFMKAILEMMFFEEKKIENTITQLKTREQGNIYVIEHDDITTAIEERNPDLAAELMSKHMDGILETVILQVRQMEESGKSLEKGGNPNE